MLAQRREARRGGWNGSGESLKNTEARRAQRKRRETEGNGGKRRGTEESEETEESGMGRGSHAKALGKGMGAAGILVNKTGVGCV